MKLIGNGFFQICFLVLYCASLSALPAPDIQSSDLLMRADQALLSGEFDTAIQAYIKGLKKARPNEKAAVYDDLGYLYLLQGDLTKAIGYLEHAKQTYPENYNVTFYLALAALLNDNFAAAADHLDDIEKNVHFDTSWMPQNEDVQLYNSYGNLLAPNEWQSLHLEKGVYIRKTGLEQSLPRLVLHPDALDERNEGLLYFIQGVMQQKKGNQDKMHAWFQAAAQAGYASRELETQRQQPERELTELLRTNLHHRMQNHQNNLLWEKLQASQAALQSGELDKAAGLLENALLIDETSFVANFTLAVLYFTQAGQDNYNEEKLEKAEIKCARAKWFSRIKITEKQDAVKCHDLLANIYFRQGKLGRAEKELNNILALDPKNSSTLYKLGGVYNLQQDFPKAETAWRDAITTARSPADKSPSQAGEPHKNPVIYLSHLSLGGLYLEQNRFSQAAAELELAVQMLPNDFRPYLELARAYIGTENRAEAAAALQKYLELGGPEQAEARRLLEKLK